METRRKIEPIILIAEDDDDEYELTSAALGELRTANRLRRVVDGEELLSYLRREGEYANETLYPAPDFILLDLNMPGKDGREALRELKSHPSLKRIPLAVLSVSNAEDDVRRCYDLGANCYLAKPPGFDALRKALAALQSYWFETAEIPSPGSIKKN
ncbi:MAG TPA: response regulator [Candidatus Eisenbacteria bacterium]|nr:response regulator [Candidatus Eisenbacteria bacterium]